MANSFVKWCRAKFFNGYKHINVLAQEEGCGRSDTETLVRAGEDELFISTPTPTPAHPHHPPTTPHGRPTPPQHPRHPLAAGTYVEEVSCDVSVAAGGDLERQEFSFTLYDFDGHGKVTKDDIAGLVRTIYEAVGSSLSLPPSGSRTIKVKLTVAPESSRTRQPAEDKEAEQEDKDEDEEDYEEEDNCGGTGGGGRGQRGRRRGGRRRSTSLQRHELLQIIQANMEKNNLFYTPLHRPHHPHYPHHHSHPHHHHHHHPRRRRPRPSCPCSPPDPAQVKARLLEPDCPCRQTHYHSHTHGPSSGSRVGCRRHHRSHSHDLTRDSPPHVFRAHLLEKAFHPLPPSNTPDQPPSPPTLPHHHHHAQPRHHHHHHHHHRSRSYDGGDTQRSSPRARVTRGSRCTQQDSPHSQKSPTDQPQPLVTSPTKESPRGGIGVTVGVSGGVENSPNPNKHRQRAAEHDRAMAQVVAWLERGTLLDNPSPTSPHSPTTPTTSPNTTTADQTHHVHQHIHHHYHHYGNEHHLPPLVL